MSELELLQKLVKVGKANGWTTLNFRVNGGEVIYTSLDGCVSRFYVSPAGYSTEKNELDYTTAYNKIIRRFGWKEA